MHQSHFLQPNNPPSQGTERAQLRKLLSRPYFSKKLDSLTAVALASSSGSDMNSKYESLMEPVCDGFEIRLGFIHQSEAIKKKAQIIDLLHQELSSLTIKNILFKTVQTELRAWVTLTSDSNKLERTLME